MPLECVLVIPSCIFSLVPDEFVGRSHTPCVSTRHVDVIQDERHFHVGIDVDQVRTHLDVHG